MWKYWPNCEFKCSIICYMLFCCCCLVAKSCLTLFRPHGLSSPPDSSVHGISQGGILEWIVTSFGGSSRPRDQTHCLLIGRWILYHWATRGAHMLFKGLKNSAVLFWWRKIPCLFVFWQPVWVVTERINFLYTLWRNPGQDKFYGEEGCVARRQGLAACSEGSVWGVSQFSVSQQTLKTVRHFENLRVHCSLKSLNVFFRVFNF